MTQVIMENIKMSSDDSTLTWWSVDFKSRLPLSIGENHTSPFPIVWKL